MKGFRRFLNERKRQMNSDGLTVLEMVVSIPIMALVGTVLFMTMGKTMMIIQDNTAYTKAANEVRVIMTDARSADTCFALKAGAGKREVTEKGIRPYTIKSEVVGECETGKTNVFKSTATRDNDSKMLFTSTTKIFISG